MKKENTSPKIGDKVVVQTHYNGKKICTIDSINNERTHFKNRNFSLEVNTSRIINLTKKYRGANLFYQSIN